MSWFKKAQLLEKYAQAPKYGRVKARDYLELMRELEQKVSGFPATDSMCKLLDRMVNDLESAVVNVYWNTRAMGHTSQGYAWPCPDCNGIRRTIEEELHDELILMNLYHSSEEYREDWGVEGDLPPEVVASFENDSYGDGIFFCGQCNKMLTFDQVAEEIKNPFPGGREVLISDQIDMIMGYLMKIKDADTFERKFPYFEGIIEWVHRSGDMSDWFIEGGEATIDKYRNAKLPSRTEGPYEDYVHPMNRDNDWDWSNI